MEKAGRNDMTNYLSSKDLIGSGGTHWLPHPISPVIRSRARFAFPVSNRTLICPNAGKLDYRKPELDPGRLRTSKAQ
jgi:hypothetical protein